MIRSSQTDVSLAQVHVSPLSSSEALAHLDALSIDGGHHYVCFCESNLFVHAHNKPQVAAAVRGAALVLPDGISLTLAARLLAGRLIERVPGPSFLPAACEHGIDKGWRHYFLGGAQGVAERLAGALSARFPGLQVVGTHSPPFRPMTLEEDQSLVREIERARPHFLWVGLGAPKQELWMAEHVGKIDVPVMLGVGAAFDFHSGSAPWAPKWIRDAGIEWAYRAVTGGRRVFFRNVRCVSKAAMIIAREAWRQRL